MAAPEARRRRARERWACAGVVVLSLAGSARRADADRPGPAGGGPRPPRPIPSAVEPGEWIVVGRAPDGRVVDRMEVRVHPDAGGLPDWDTKGGATLRGEAVFAWDLVGVPFLGRGAGRSTPRGDRRYGPEASWWVEVSAARLDGRIYAPVLVGPVRSGRRVEIPLAHRAESEVAGVVVDGNGRGVPDAEVGVFLKRGSPTPRPEWEAPLGTATTDAEGRYRIGGLPLGDHWMEIDAPVGHASAWPIEVVAGGIDLRHLLEPGRRLTVTMGAQGGGRAGVFHAAWTARSGRERRLEVPFGDDGLVRVRLDPSVTHYLYVTFPGEPGRFGSRFRWSPRGLADVVEMRVGERAPDDR